MSAITHALYDFKNLKIAWRREAKKRALSKEIVIVNTDHATKPHLHQQTPTETFPARPKQYRQSFIDDKVFGSIIGLYSLFYYYSITECRDKVNIAFLRLK